MTPVTGAAVLATKTPAIKPAAPGAAPRAAQLGAPLDSASGAPSAASSAAASAAAPARAQLSPALRALMSEGPGGAPASGGPATNSTQLIAQLIDALRAYEAGRRL